jgi:hypothetical protein
LDLPSFVFVSPSFRVNQDLSIAAQTGYDCVTEKLLTRSPPSTSRRCRALPSFCSILKVQSAFIVENYVPMLN